MNPMKKFLQLMKDHPMLIGVQVVILTGVILAANKYYTTYAPATFTRAGTEEKQVHVQLFPKQIHAQPGNTFAVTPLVSSNQKKIGFISLTLTFNPAHIRFAGVDNATVNQLIQPLFEIDAQAVNQTGKITVIYGGTAADNLPDKAIQLSQLTFEVLTEDESEISLFSEESEVVFEDQDTAEFKTETSRVTSKVKPDKEEPENDADNPETTESATPVVSAEPTVTETVPAVTITETPASEPTTTQTP